MSEFKPGLEGVVAFETEIAEPDRDGGALRYRGVDIEGLVGRVPFEKVWGLLVDGGPEPGLVPAPRYRAADLTGDRFGHADQPGLAGSIVGGTSLSHHARYGADADDSAKFVANH